MPPEASFAFKFSLKEALEVLEGALAQAVEGTSVEKNDALQSLGECYGFQSALEEGHPPQPGTPAATGHPPNWAPAPTGHSPPQEPADCLAPSNPRILSQRGPIGY